MRCATGFSSRRCSCWPTLFFLLCYTTYYTFNFSTKDSYSTDSQSLYGIINQTNNQCSPLQRAVIERHESPPVQLPSAFSHSTSQGRGYSRVADRTTSHRILQKGKHWVFVNLVPAEKEFESNASVTYTTHGEYTFLDNLIIIAARWQGPISVAVYAPGSDFKTAIDVISNLRNCASDDIRRFATFHLISDIKYFTDEIPNLKDVLRSRTECKEDFFDSLETETFRRREGLLYPINILRNTARANAKTYFVFASDIELYPSVNVIQDFLGMIRRSNDIQDSTSKRVYVLPPFEVKKEEDPPQTKKELLEMLKEGSAIPFHVNTCPQCHEIPKYKEWTKADTGVGLSVFHVSKRHPPYAHWEPFYIGTDQDPPFDERLSWEGKQNKLPQGFIMCLLDYEFHILDNAFVVHKPGIKLPKSKKTAEESPTPSYNHNPKSKGLLKVKNPAVIKTIGQGIVINTKLFREYTKMYGTNTNCSITF